MNRFERISVDPKIMRGRPCIKGTRIPVSTILSILSKGYSKEKLLTSYPELRPEDIDASLAYCSRSHPQVFHTES